MASPLQISSPVARWRAARRLYPIYCAFAVQFGLDTPPYEDLDEADPQNDPNFLERVEAWFASIDARLHVAQFRQVLQATAVAASEDKLQALIERIYGKPDKTETDRDKLDFLLVQYFALCAPPSLPDRDFRLDDAAEVLSPILGTVALDFPEWLRPVDSWIPILQKVSTLGELQASNLVQQARQLKAAARHLYYTPVSLVAFTRFSYLMRRAYFRLISAELKIIEAGLEKLASYGQTVLDCSAAQMSAATPVDELRHFCQTYKKPALPEYSVDTSVLRVVQLRQIVDAALAEIELPNDPVLAEIEERCRRVEAELVAMRKLAAGLAAERRRTTGDKGGLSPFEEVLEVPFELPAAATVLAASVAVTPAPPAPAPPKPASVAQPAPPPRPAIPEIQVETAPVVQHADVAVPSLTDAMEEIRKKLSAAPRKGISSLNIAGTALLLSPDEVEAFLRPRDGSSIDLQRSLAARALLLQAVELQKKTASPELLTKTMQLCRTEAASIQQHSAEAKQSQNSAAAAILNASASQLLSLLRQVERMSRAS
ncbi:MAG: hypothetical protein ACRD3E_14090 [Terriglobales bacterium]